MDLPKMLESKDAESRIAALKYIHRNRVDMNLFRFYPDISTRNNIAERYWFAKNLRYRRGPMVRKSLAKLLDDSHFNVVCMAFHSLGYAGGRKDIHEIIQRIENSDNWYEQWYAYRAMRKLGWMQKRLN